MAGAADCRPCGGRSACGNSICRRIAEYVYLDVTSAAQILMMMVLTMMIIMMTIA